MKPVLIGDEAREEIREACRWYESQQSGLSSDFVAELGVAIKTIAERPRSFPIIGHNARRILLRRFPYLVLFAEDDNAIGVVGVFHTARDPATWLRRAARRERPQR